MIIKQNNVDNTTGFVRMLDSDLGVDKDGNLADGFRFVDALWWADSPGTEILDHLTPELSLSFFLEDFKKLWNRTSKFIVFNIKPKSVLDLGSGCGELCSRIRDLDKDIVTVTVDANEESKKSPYIDENHFIGRTDKSLDFVDENGNKVLFDLIVSLEHFEHISEQTVHILMENIKNHSKIGTQLIFTVNHSSYSMPYKGKDYNHIHCNVKPVGYWANLVKEYGFEIYKLEYFPLGWELTINNKVAPLPPPDAVLKTGDGFFLGRGAQSSEVFCKKIR